NAAGQERELERLPAANDGVAGVGPAVVADHEVVLVGEEIDDFSLGLVAPLKADDTGAGHSCYLPRRAAVRRASGPGHGSGFGPCSGLSGETEKTPATPQAPGSHGAAPVSYFGTLVAGWEGVKGNRKVAVRQRLRRRARTGVSIEGLDVLPRGRRLGRQL